MALTPTLFLGGAAAPHLFQSDQGYTDGGMPYEVFAESRPLAPAGGDTECVFTFCYLETVHYGDDVSWWLAALVDDVVVATQRLDLTGTVDGSAKRTSHVFALTVPNLDGAGVEFGRRAPRGVWFKLQIFTDYLRGEPGAALQAGQQIIETVDVEFGPLRPIRSGQRLTEIASI